MPDKLTDKEIVKAFKICNNLEYGYCSDCPYEYCDRCIREVARNTLAYINRLEAENERLQDCIDEQDIEIASLWKRIEDTKAEAYKEFVELVHCHCESIINHEWNKKVSPVSWADAYEQFDEEVDNLLKEKVGENDG